MNTRFGSNINQVICGKHDVFVMFHYQHTVANVAQPLQCTNKLLIIPLVQTD